MSGGAEASADKCVDGVFLVSIGHDDGVVLGTHVALHSLAASGCSGVDVLTSLVSTNEGDSSDVGVCANIGNGVFTTLDDVDNAIGDTRLLEQVEEDFHGAGYLLRRLHYVGVSEGDGQGEHPQGAHSGEVEGSNTSADTEGGSV